MSIVLLSRNAKIPRVLSGTQSLEWYLRERWSLEWPHEGASLRLKGAQAHPHPNRSERGSFLRRLRRRYVVAGILLHIFSNIRMLREEFGQFLVLLHPGVAF